LPSTVDLRGLLTFGILGLGVFIIAWLMGRSKQFPQGLSYWGYLLAILLIVLYLGRLNILDPKNPIVAADALLSGFVVSVVEGGVIAEQAIKSN
jgi:FtsH-binding integral membrane protein